jgi:transcription elongation GreA/GreB family factor
LPLQAANPSSNQASLNVAYDIRVMSRAFIREQDAENVETLPDRPVSDQPNDVTQEGMLQIEANIKAEQDAFAKAQANDDRGAMAVASRELRYWNSRRATARVIAAPSTNDEVRFGCTVTIVRDDGRTQTFRILGEDEADPSKGTISHVSPLARALFGRSVGDTIQLAGRDIEILAIA